MAYHHIKKPEGRLVFRFGYSQLSVKYTEHKIRCFEFTVDAPNA